MVDISPKTVIVREAFAEGVFRLTPSTVRRMRTRKVEKGDVVAAAEVAAIMAAKNTPSILPFCHTIPITTIRTSHSYRRDSVTVEAYVKRVARTGVEMEALTAVTAYLLTIWDIVKQYEQDPNGHYPSTEILIVRVTKKIKR